MEGINHGASGIELKEKEKKQPDMVVNFIRHGKPEYTSEEKVAGEYEGNLTAEGVAQIEKSALDLVADIDKEKEIVLIWKSPKRRAQQSAEIIKNILINNGVQVLEKEASANKTSLKDTKLGPDFNASDWSNWMAEWVRQETELPNGAEKPEEVKSRVGRILTYLERISKKVKLDAGKKLRIVCITHEEVFRDLLEEGFEMGTQKGTGPTYGEILKIGVSSSDKEGVKFNMEYRGKDSEIGFDKETRQFKKG